MGVSQAENQGFAPPFVLPAATQAVIALRNTTIASRGKPSGAVSAYGGREGKKWIKMLVSCTHYGLSRRIRQCDDSPVSPGPLLLLRTVNLIIE